MKLPHHFISSLPVHMCAVVSSRFCGPISFRIADYGLDCSDRPIYNSLKNFTFSVLK